MKIFITTAEAEKIISAYLRSKGCKFEFENEECKMVIFLDDDKSGSHRGFQAFIQLP